MRVARDELLGSLPPEWPEDLLPEIRTLVEGSCTKIVVLDDDPTGTQTVYDVPVLTEWSPASLAAILSEPGPLAYVSVNSRSLPLPEAQALNREIAANLIAASTLAGRDFVLVSRSDSTLRGHYPGEVTALVEGLGQRFDGTLLVPFFLEGGRLTVDDVHYVAEGDWLTPAGETEYARDAAFPYQNSDLRAWVSEKHGGQVKPPDVASISLIDLRRGGPQAVAIKLGQVTGGQICVVNAVTYRDLEVLVAGLLQAEAAGRRFIYRTAASFIRARAGLPSRRLLTSLDLSASRGQAGGLVVAGSYIEKSTAQIEAASSLSGIAGLEVSVERLLDAASRDEEIRRVTRLADESLVAGRDTLLYTSRRLITGADETSSLQIGQTISAALVEIVNSLAIRPAWMIAKGGNTASTIATRGLRVKRVHALGQAIPGVPIWRTGPESRWPDLIYVVFPGNVGGPDAIARMIRILRSDFS